MGIETIAAVVAVAATVASTAYAMSQGGGGGGGGGSGLGSAAPTMTLPGQQVGPLPTNLAAAGALRPELQKAVTPAWGGGLAGSPGQTGPVPGAGSATATPLGQAMDQTASIFQSSM